MNEFTYKVLDVDTRTLIAKVAYMPSDQTLPPFNMELTLDTDLFVGSKEQIAEKLKDHIIHAAPQHIWEQHKQIKSALDVEEVADLLNTGVEIKVSKSDIPEVTIETSGIAEEVL